MITIAFGKERGTDWANLAQATGNQAIIVQCATASQQTVPSPAPSWRDHAQGPDWSGPTPSPDRGNGWDRGL
jgi:hypothetical protein